MLEGTAKVLFDLLKRLDQDPTVTYEKLVADQRDAVAKVQAGLDELLSLEGLCDATTLRTPSGRKRRKDRGTPRTRNGAVQKTTEQTTPPMEDPGP